MTANELFLRFTAKEKGYIVKDIKWLFQAKIDKEFLKWSSIELSKTQQDDLTKCVQLLQTGKPLAYILGTAEFYNCLIKVNENVLIPRLETETLCEYVIKENPGLYEVLDLCTGSGCIAIALSKNLQNFKLTASDIDINALSVARENAQLNNVNIEFVQSDLLENIDKTFDIIVSNPPYLSKLEMQSAPKSVTDFEPKLALFGGESGLDFYVKIAETAPKNLAENGLIYLEVGDKQAEDVAQILSNNFKNIEIKKDLFGIERFVKARRK